MDEPMKAYLTTREAADQLKCSVRSVRRYVSDGRLPNTKWTGGQFRIPMADIEAFLQPVPGAQA